IAGLCETVYVMYAGRAVESGTAGEVLGAPAHPYTQRLRACVPELGPPQRRIVPISGMAPPANALPPGCAFAPRCPLALPACALREISGGAGQGGHRRPQSRGADE